MPRTRSIIPTTGGHYLRDLGQQVDRVGPMVPLPTTLERSSHESQGQLNPMLVYVLYTGMDL